MTGNVLSRTVRPRHGVTLLYNTRRRNNRQSFSEARRVPPPRTHLSPSSGLSAVRPPSTSLCGTNLDGPRPMCHCVGIAGLEKSRCRPASGEDLPLSHFTALPLAPQAQLNPPTPRTTRSRSWGWPARSSCVSGPGSTFWSSRFSISDPRPSGRFKDNTARLQWT
jgi:hypothetical protein